MAKARAEYQFQTLKGSLQTQQNNNAIEQQNEFQTLKGSLQTQHIYIAFLRRPDVSNPQRIATNDERREKYEETKKVSNPQRIATNGLELSLHWQFQYRFKPSKDRYKLFPEKTYVRGRREFQTLKGSLQTPGVVSVISS